MKKTLLTTAILSIISITPQSANAALLNGSTLSFDTPATSGSFTSLPAANSGSYFAMEVSVGTQIVTGVSGFDNLVIGTTQLASSSTIGNIDNPWMFSGNQGVHESTSNTNIISASGDTVTVDFSGWGVFWNENSINLGTGISNGVATITCDTGSGCSDGAGYVLDYFATTAVGDISSKGGVSYNLHLEGTISAVPVPAAIWLFTSGLIGLFAVFRKTI